MTGWTEPAWLGERARLDRRRSSGGSDSPRPERSSSRTSGRGRPRSACRRPAGDVWFKAAIPVLAHEAGGRRRSSRGRRPDLVPELLAADFDRGWMLMADGGTRLRELIEEERDLGRWLDVLPRYAELQIDLAADADRLVAVGGPDRRLARCQSSTSGCSSSCRHEFEGTAPRVRGDVRAARLARHPRDDPARRPPRRAGLRPRRAVPASSTGATRASRTRSCRCRSRSKGRSPGASTTSRTRSTSRRSATRTSSRSRGMRRSASCRRHSTSRCASAGSAARSTRSRGHRRSSSPAPRGAARGPPDASPPGVRVDAQRQPKNARATSYQSSVTVFSSAVASSSETATTSLPRSDAICPNAPASTRSAALSPKRVARMRS